MNEIAHNNDMDKHVDDILIKCLDITNPKSFFLFAGAGSGKTRSLITALKKVWENFGKSMQLRNQQIAVITYTNAASEEIVERLRKELIDVSLFEVSTIHSFAWKVIQDYTTDIKQWLKIDIARKTEKWEDEEKRGRKGTDASRRRLSNIEKGKEKLESLDNILKFKYDPNGENTDKSSLQHEDVISICASFLREKLINKVLLAILVASFAVTMGLFVQSCNSEDAPSQEIQITKADILIASDEYQEYAIESRGLADRFLHNYSNLSKEEQNKVMTLLDDLTREYNENNNIPMEKYREFCDIIRIDYTVESTKLEKLKSNVLAVADAEGINKREIMVASLKYETQNYTPTLKSGGEGLSPAQLKCVNSCYAAWKYNAISCVCPPQHPILVCICGILETNALAKCVEACA